MESAARGGNPDLWGRNTKMSDQVGFSTRRVVVLGAGFGGLTIASELSPHAVAGDADVTVVERKASFSVGF